MESRNHDFKIGEWYVDTTTCSLFNETNDVHIEPKAMEVLQILAQAQGAVVSRNAIMEKVWQGRYVTDYALNNIIASLRKYLDADNKDKYIITRPKRGYQLNCEVSWSSKQSDANTEKVLAKESLVNHKPNESAPTLHTSEISSRKNKSWMLIVGLCLLIAIGIFSSIYPTGSRDKTQTPLDRKTIAVLPFAVVTDTPEITYLASGLANEIINQLSISPNVLVLDRRSSFAFVEEDPSNRTPKKASDKLGVNYILDGNVSKIDEQTSINAVLYDELGNKLWSSDFAVNSSTIFSLQDDILNAVFAALELTPLVHAETGKYYRSTSADAFQQLLQGRALNGQGNLDAYKEAIVRFKMAIELDPNYASAYVDLAIGYLVLHTAKHITLEDANKQAKPLIDKALSLIPELPSAIAAQAIFAMYNEQTSKAIEYYNRALELDPNSFVARLNLAWLYQREKQFDKALFHYKLARELHPLNAGVNFSIARIFLEKGKAQQAYDNLEYCVGFATTNTSCPLEFAFLQRLVGKPDAAKATFAELLSWYKSEDNFYVLQNQGFHAWWENDLVLTESYYQGLYQQHGAQYNFLPSLAWLKWQQLDTKDIYKSLNEQLSEGEEFTTEYQLKALALLAYAEKDCDAMFGFYEQLEEVKPLVHGLFMELIEGFSNSLNIAACHIANQQPQLANPLLKSVSDALETADELAQQSPGIILIQAKLNKLRGETIDTRSLIAILTSKQYPHVWMINEDWAFKL